MVVTEKNCNVNATFYSTIYTVFQKIVHQGHIDNFVNSQRIFIFLSLRSLWKV